MKEWYHTEERIIMKTIKYEVKLETSVKIILGVLALGIFLNVFSTPIAMELFGIKRALAEYMSGTLNLHIVSWPGLSVYN